MMKKYNIYLLFQRKNDIMMVEVRKMKKHNLFKVIMITFLAVVVLTWIIPAGGYSSGSYVESGITPLGLFDLVRTPLIAFANLTQYAYILLVIGGFYGVLNKTGAYSKLVDKIASKRKGKAFLAVIIVLLALLQSLTGATFAIFILVPFLAAIILKKGYSKITAMASTIGAMLVGSMASTYSYSVVGYLSEYLGIDFGANILPSIVLFVLAVALYTFFVVKKAKVQMREVEEEIVVEIPEEEKKTKTSKTAKETKTTKTTKAETKKTKDVKELKPKTKKIKKVRQELMVSEIPLLEENKNEKKSTTTLLVSLIFVVLVALIAMFNWSSIFEITFFEDLYTKITEVTINGYPIFKNLLGTFSAFGWWSNYDLIIFLVLMTFVIGWLYNVKFNDMLDGFASGAKKMLKPAFFVMLATVLYATMFSTTTGDNIYYTIVNNLFGDREKVNLVMSGILSFIGGILFSDFQSLVATLYLPYQSVFANFGDVAAFILQTIYGIAAFIAPCSIPLILGLSFFDVSYKEWFKNIWKYLLLMLIIIGILVAVLVFM